MDKAKMKCEKNSETLTKNSAKRRTSGAKRTTKPQGASAPLVHLDRIPQDQGWHRHGKRHKQHVTNQPAIQKLADRFHIFKYVDVNKMAPDSGHCYSFGAIVAPLQPTSQSEHSRKVSYLNSQEKRAFSKCYKISHTRLQLMWIE